MKHPDRNTAPGTKLRCVNDSDRKSQGLENGDVYSFARPHPAVANCFYVEGIDQHAFLYTRFELVDATEEASVTTAKKPDRTMRPGTRVRAIKTKDGIQKGQVATFVEKGSNEIGYFAWFDLNAMTSIAKQALYYNTFELADAAASTEAAASAGLNEIATLATPVGATLELIEGGSTSAVTGARATVTGHADPWIRVDWVRDGRAGSQADGGYLPRAFRVVGLPQLRRRVDASTPVGTLLEVWQNTKPEKIPARVGARARVVAHWSTGDKAGVRVEWVKNGLEGGLTGGGWFYSYFHVVEEEVEPDVPTGDASSERVQPEEPKFLVDAIRAQLLGQLQRRVETLRSADRHVVRALHVGVARGRWRPMNELDKERFSGTEIDPPVLAKIQHNFVEDQRWSGCLVPIRHEGFDEDGDDLGWRIALPVSMGNLLDDAFVGWSELEDA